MEECSDSPRCYWIARRLVSLPGQEKALSKLVVKWWHNSHQEVSVSSAKFMSHDRVVPVRATGK
jgi:hypothetical protein